MNNMYNNGYRGNQRSMYNNVKNNSDCGCSGNQSGMSEKFKNTADCVYADNQNGMPENSVADSFKTNTNCGGNLGSCDKNRIMQNLYELGFVMTEALLYLDTHPGDGEAIEYYNSMRERYNEAVAAYESAIGPLTFNSTGADNYFNWAATPLPWEKEGC